MTMAATTGRFTTTFEMLSDREGVMTHVFDAPRALVWRAHTDPTIIPRWWGPRYLTTTVEVLDARPGGRWRFLQRDPKGTVHAFNGVYREVEEPSRLVQTFEYEGAPGEILVDTLTFEDLGGRRTKLTVHTLFPSKETFDAMREQGMEGGAREGNQRLEELLWLDLAPTPAIEQGPLDLVIERTFKAPRALVWRAYTEPEQIERWWGPNGCATAVSHMDVRPGGVWQFVMHAPDGTDYPNYAVYQEVAPPERLVFLYGSGPDDAPDERFLATVTLTEVNGATHVVQRMRFPSRAALEHTIGFGAVELGYQTLGRLAQHLDNLAV